MSPLAALCANQPFCPNYTDRLGSLCCDCLRRALALLAEDILPDADAPDPVTVCGEEYVVHHYGQIGKRAIGRPSRWLRAVPVIFVEKKGNNILDTEECR